MKNGKNIIEVTLLSKGMKLNGDLQSLNDIRVEGEINGSVISLAKVIVSEEAVVVGDISAFSLELYGTLKGNVSVDDHFVMGKDADFEGEVICKSIEIAKGGKFMGRVRSHGQAFELDMKETEKKVINFKPILLKPIETMTEKPEGQEKEVFKKVANGFESKIDFGGNPTLNGFF